MMCCLVVIIWLTSMSFMLVPVCVGCGFSGLENYWYVLVVSVGG